MEVLPRRAKSGSSAHRAWLLAGLVAAASATPNIYGQQNTQGLLGHGNEAFKRGDYKAAIMISPAFLRKSRGNRN
jgi:hypothetical protein